jgi:hypothetical protein
MSDIFQGFIDSMIEIGAREKSKYHLTYGELIDALKNASPDALFDERVKGIGSWRGSYIEIALFTEEEGYYVEKSEFNGDYEKEYKEWKKENTMSGKLPKNANELGKLLESLIGLQFVGYKGGNFTIERWKPLWLETDGSTCEEKAIIGIDKDLKLITKEINEK